MQIDGNPPKILGLKELKVKIFQNKDLERFRACIIGWKWKNPDVSQRQVDCGTRLAPLALVRESWSMLPVCSFCIHGQGHPSHELRYALWKT